MRFAVIFLVLVSTLSRADDTACQRLGLTSVPEAFVAGDYCASVFFEEGVGKAPRGVISDEENNLIYIDANRTFMESFAPFHHTSIVLVYDDDRDGTADGKKSATHVQRRVFRRAQPRDRAPWWLAVRVH